MMEAQARDEEGAIQEQEQEQEPLLGNNNKNSNINIDININETENNVAVAGTVGAETERTAVVQVIGEDEPLPGLPIEQYKSYLRFFCHFSKYIVTVLILNLVINSFRWRDQGLYILSSLSVFNTVFFFLAAKAIDRDVAKVDAVAEQEMQSGQGGAENPSQEDNSCLGMDCNNHKNIYGRVARKIDVWLISACKTHPTTMEPRPTGTSFLSHLCWVLWAFLFASSYAGVLGVARYKFTVDTNPMTDLHKTIPTDLESPAVVFANISHFPKGLQLWITKADIHRERRFDFPTNSAIDTLSRRDKLNLLSDRIIDEFNGVLFELISKNNTIVKLRHNDIESPHHFIPVQNSIDEKDPERASQYCFVSGDYFNRAYPSTEDMVHCTDASSIENGKELALKTVKLDWLSFEQKHSSTQISHPYEDDSLMAASYKDLVFFSKRCNRDSCKHVFQLNPETMETITVYHAMNGDDNRYNGDDDRYNGDDDRYNGGYNKYSGGYEFFNGVCGLGFASYFLIVKQGFVSGFFPLSVNLSLVFSLLNHFSDVGVPQLRLTLGTVFFLFLIFKNGQRSNICPSWFGKEASTWALYGWISSFLIYEQLFYVRNSNWRGAEELAVLFLILVGIALGHPTVQATGYYMILFGCLILIFDFQHVMQDPEEIFLPIFGGLGCVVLGNWISTHKEMIYSRLTYVAWYISRWFYLSMGGSRPTRTSA